MNWLKKKRERKKKRGKTLNRLKLIRKVNRGRQLNYRNQWTREWFEDVADKFRNFHRGETKKRELWIEGSVGKRLFFAVLHLIMTSPPPSRGCWQKKKKRKRNRIIRVTGSFWHGSFTRRNRGKHERAIIVWAISENGPGLNSWHTSDTSHPSAEGGDGRRGDLIRWLDLAAKFPRYSPSPPPPPKVQHFTIFYARGISYLRNFHWSTFN